ncbi:MAG: FAD-dependent oxidoreductase [Deltaproteobacteria bacterium]|jgi:renalase
MRISIIGAGIAGATAARALVDAGHDVTLLDKGRRVAGRVSTRAADGGRYHFDHGAQYFTARSAAFRDQTERWIGAGVAAPWLGRIGVAAGGVVRAKDDTTQRFVGIPGMNAIVEDLVSQVPSVRCGVRIEGLREVGSKWVPVTDQGESLAPADFVLVTAPAPQAAKLVPSDTLKRICSGAKMAPCWAVMAAFDAALPIDCDGIFFDGGPLRWAARNSSKPGRDGSEAWVLHASDDWSQRMLEADADAIEIALLDAFFTATGTKPRAPQYVRAHRWRYATPLDEDGPRFVVDGSVGIAGDWLAGARVEGAYLAGRDAARGILELA